MSNPTLKILPALMIAIAAALVTQPMRAGINPIDTLVITENSSTSLTAILNGTTSLNVTPSSADNWVIHLPGVGPSVFGGRQFWGEPEAGFVNAVTAALGLPDQLFVTSEFGPGQSGLANNTADTTTFLLNFSALSVTFNDLGDVAAPVPDTGTTASLLGLSITGLAFLRRKLC